MGPGLRDLEVACGDACSLSMGAASCDLLVVYVISLLDCDDASLNNSYKG